MNYEELVETGIAQIPPVVNGDQYIEIWEYFSKYMIEDWDNAYIYICFQPYNKWPSKEIGKTQKHLVSKFSKNEFYWKTLNQYDSIIGKLFEIELYPFGVTQKIYFLNDYYRKFFKSEINLFYQNATTALSKIADVSKMRGNTGITYISGEKFLPNHTDNYEPMTSLRVNQLLQQTRNHTITVNDVDYNFKPNETYIMNAYHNHEIKPCEGYRLSISSNYNLR